MQIKEHFDELQYIILHVPVSVCERMNLWYKEM